MSKEEQENKVEDVMEEIDLDAIPDVESGIGIDFEEFTGTKKKISEIKMIETKSNFDDNGEYVEDLGRKVKVLKVITETVTTFKNKEGVEKDIKASELFNMKKNDEGKWGIAKSEKAKIRKFMARQKVSTLKALIGTSVILKDYTDKKKNTYLGFVTE